MHRHMSVCGGEHDHIRKVFLVPEITVNCTLPVRMAML